MRQVTELRVVLTDKVFPDTVIEQAVLDEVGAHLSVAEGDRGSVLDAARDADAILNTYFPLTGEDIAQLTRCRIIARYGIGVDNVDVSAAAERGIVVTNVPDYCIEEVAVHALALVLALVRKLPAAQGAVARGDWSVGALRPMARPSELTVGLVGYGRIGRRLAFLLDALGMRVIVHDPYLAGPAPTGVELVELDALLQGSDVVSLHCPLTEQTRGLIGSRELELMGPHAVLVNTSRGPLVQLGDLLAALRAGRIAGAGLDVFETEPVDPDILVGVPGLLVSPHIGYYSEASIRESQTKAATQVVKVLRGEPVDYAVMPLPTQQR